MYGDMAANAFAAGLEAQATMRHLRGVKFRMAFQAKLATLAPHQQHPVVAPVRIVARRAAFHFHRGMLVDKRPALLHVALHAGFRSCANQAGCIDAPVRIVAVRTLHQPFGNAVVHRQMKISLESSGGTRSKAPAPIASAGCCAASEFGRPAEAS